MKILIVDDEKEVLTSLSRLFKRRNYNDVETIDSGEEAVQKILANNYDVILLDMLLPDINGLEILSQTKPSVENSEFIILTAVDSIEAAVKSVRLGAYDFLVKPVDPEKIFLTVERAYERKGLLNTFRGNKTEKDSKIHAAFNTIITRSLKIIDILAYAEIMSKSRNPILITGESGTGKELLAKAIHKISHDKSAPFIPVNVASVPESLFESHFFGHIEGAFTGANRSHEGYFRQANGGTLFLDEIGELPLNQQAKFLRVLEDHLVTPIGDSKAFHEDVRIISATNIDINEACKSGKFRLDLFYRLKSAQIHLPPLRERVEDIILLSEAFIKRAAKKYNKTIIGISEEAKQFLLSRDFPGNVRELYQLVENAVLLAGGSMLTCNDFGVTLETSRKNNLSSLKDNTDNHYVRVLNYVGGDKNAAAEILGVTLRQVQRKIKELKENPKWGSKLTFDQ